MVHMVRSEDSEKGSDAGDGSNEAAMWDDFEYTASNGPLSAYWGQNYKIIYQCNEILDDIANSDHKDDTESIRNRGEASSSVLTATSTWYVPLVKCLW